MSVVNSGALFFLLHNHIINIQKFFFRRSKRECNFSLFFLLHKRAKPILPPCLPSHPPARTQNLYSPLALTSPPTYPPIPHSPRTHPPIPPPTHPPILPPIHTSLSAHPPTHPTRPPIHAYLTHFGFKKPWSKAQSDTLLSSVQNVTTSRTIYTNNTNKHPTHLKLFNMGPNLQRSYCHSNIFDEPLGGRKRGPDRVMGRDLGFMESTHCAIVIIRLGPFNGVLRRVLHP